MPFFISLYCPPNLILPLTTFIVLKRRRINCWSPSGSERPSFPLCLTFVVFPSNFHSHASRFSPAVFWVGPPPVWYIPVRFPLPPLPPPVSQNVFGLARPVWLDSTLRNEGVRGDCSNVKPQRASLDWLTYYFTLHSTPCTSRYSWIYTCIHSHTGTSCYTEHIQAERVAG